jgi:hypothetical protein
MNSEVTWDNLDWAALRRLRETFIAGQGGQGDYWQTERDLANYDLTYGQRIGWKWRHVLGELARLGWTPPSGPVWDWGCGTGVAVRGWLGHWGAAGARTWLSDRSALAVRFAFRQLARDFPGVEVSAGHPPRNSGSMVLLSHVITELSDDQLSALLNDLRGATAIVWVEPGTKAAADRLVQARERLRATFQPVAPCTHSAACGMLAGENSRHWCHHFASTPPEVYTSRHWTRFSQISGIDLRSLPVSYLVLDNRPVNALPSGATRIIGAPRLYKGYARLLACDGSGVHDRRLTQRVFPEPYRQVKKALLDPLQAMECDGDEVRRIDPI